MPTHSKGQRRLVPERNRETSQGEGERKREDPTVRERATFTEVNQQLLITQTTNTTLRVTHKHTLFLTGIRRASDGKRAAFTRQPSVRRELEPV